MAGEDFVRRKLDECAFLIGDLPNLEISLYFRGRDVDIVDLESQDRVGENRAFISNNVFAKFIQSRDGEGTSKAEHVHYGILQALNEGCDRIGYTDADLSSNLGLLGPFLAELENVDGVIASRALPNSWVIGRGSDRLVLSRLFNLLVRTCLGLPYLDTQAGLKLFTSSAARMLTSEPPRDRSMAFDTELLTRLHKSGKVVKEIPIVWFESPLESASASPDVMARMLGGVLQQTSELAASNTKANLNNNEHFESFLEEPLKSALVVLGTDEELRMIVTLLRSCYKAIQPKWVEDVCRALRLIALAILRNELTADEIGKLIDVLSRAANIVLESRHLEFALHRFPRLQDIIQSAILDRELLRPLLCFFLGSQTVGKFFPGERGVVPSYFEIDKELEPLVRLQTWVRKFLAAELELRPNQPNRSIKSIRVVVSQRSVKLQENLRACSGRKLHLAIPMMQAVPKLPEHDRPEHDRLANGHGEFRSLSNKLRDYEALIRGQDQLPEIHIHAVTRLKNKDLRECANACQLPKTAARLFDRGIRITLYAIESDLRVSEQTTLSCYDLNKKGLIGPREVTIFHKTHALKAEPGTFPKGVALYLGLSAALVESRRDIDPLVGYTVSTQKIPLGEVAILANAMHQATGEAVAIGSRRMPDSVVTNKPLLNLIRSAVNVFVLRAIFPDLADVRDFQASLKLFTPKLLDEILTGGSAGYSLRSSGPECDVELLQLARIHGGRVVESPIAFYESQSMQESLGIELGANVVIGAIELKKWTPDRDEVSLLVEHGGQKYSVQRIGSGTEHAVFKLANCLTNVGPHKLVVKVPHESIDTAFYLPMESFVVNFLRPMGFATETGRTEQKLFGELPIVRDLLRSTGFWARLIVGLRHWGKFNSMLLRVIRAWELKTFKSTGYQYAVGARHVARFQMIEKGQEVRLAWRQGDTECTRIFDYRDHVLVMEYIESNLEQRLRERLAAATPLNRVACFCEWVREVFGFSIALALEDGLFDLDTNGMSDLGIDQNHNIKLLDPGEVESLGTPEGKELCLEVLADRLDAPPEASELKASVEGLTYQHRLFESFQFRQLDQMMDSCQLSEAERHQVQCECINQMKKFLDVLIGSCTTNISKSTSSTENPDFWCIVDSTNRETRPTPEQVAGVARASGHQGRYQGRTAIQKGAMTFLPDFVVPASKRGLYCDFVESPSEPPVRDESTPYCLYVGPTELVRYGKTQSRHPIDWQHAIHAFRGPALAGIGAVFGFDEGLDTPQEFPLVMLDNGSGSRTGPLASAAGSKGKIRLFEQEMWRHSARGYGSIVQGVRNSCADSTVFAAADVLLRIQEDSSFLKALSSYFATTDDAGQKPGVFFLAAPENENGNPVIPIRTVDQQSWLRNTLPRRLQDIAAHVPGLHVFARHLDDQQEVQRSNNSTKSPLGLENESNSAGSPFGGVVGAARWLLRDELVAEAISQFGGLRLPFLNVLRKDVIKQLKPHFYQTVGDGPSIALGWHEMIAFGLQCDTESQFLATVASKPIGGLDALRQLYVTLREIRQRSWTEPHQRAAQGVWQAFANDIASGKVTWYGIEGPAELFGFHVTTGPQYTTGEEDTKVHIFGSSKLTKAVSKNIKYTIPGKTLMVALAGDDIMDLKNDFQLELLAPISNVAGRSNLFPYLIYFAGRTPSAPTWNSLPETNSLALSCAVPVYGAFVECGLPYSKDSARTWVKEGSSRRNWLTFGTGKEWKKHGIESLLNYTRSRGP